MSVQEEITTRRAKSIILNHWIYNYLPFGAIFSAIRLSSFRPIAAWLATWLILGITYSSIYTCDDDDLCSKMKEFNRSMQNSMEKLDSSFEELHKRYNTDEKPYDRKYKPEEYSEPFEQGAFIKQICNLLMIVNFPGIMGGMVSAYTIKSARKKQDQINNEE